MENGNGLEQMSILSRPCIIVATKNRRKKGKKDSFGVGVHMTGFSLCGRSLGSRYIPYLANWEEVPESPKGLNIYFLPTPYNFYNLGQMDQSSMLHPSHDVLQLWINLLKFSLNVTLVSTSYIFREFKLLLIPH